MNSIAGICLAAYSFILGLFTLFFLGWDNKGAVSWLQKSPSQWLEVVTVGLVAIFVGYAAKLCFKDARVPPFITVCLGALFIAHLLIGVIPAQEAGIWVMGVPAIFLAMGVILLLWKYQATSTLTS